MGSCNYILLFVAFLSICKADGTLWNQIYLNFTAKGNSYTRGPYDEDLAKGLVVFAGLAYEEDGNKFNQCIGEEFTVYQNLSAKVEGDTIHGFVGMHSNGFIVASYEGTYTDWQLFHEWKEMKGEQFLDYKDVQVMDYWDNVAKQMLNDTRSALTKLVPQCLDCPVYFTGHSLGAATMTLVLAYLFEENFEFLPKERLIAYTFGEPRVGNVNFADLFNGHMEHYRVVHHKDMIPHVPCCCTDKDGNCARVDGKFCPFHTVTEIFYEDDDMGDSNYEVCTRSPIGEDPKCANGVSWTKFSVDQHLHYFGAHVGLMCETMLNYPVAQPTSPPKWERFRDTDNGGNSTSDLSFCR